MPNVLSTAIIRSAAHWYEKLPYTSLTTSLAPGRTVLFAISDIATVSKSSKVVEMTDIAVSNVSNVDVAITHAANTMQTTSAAWPTGLTPVFSSGEGHAIKSLHGLGIALVNSTGAAQPNFQVNYSAATKTLTVAEKIFYGVGLTSLEQSLATKYFGKDYAKIVDGIRPLPVSEMLKRAFYGQVIDSLHLAYESPASANASTVDNRTPNAGELLVITKMAASATAVGDQVTVSLDRDTEDGFVSFLADNCSINSGFDTWIPVTQHYSLTVSAQVAQTVPLRLEVLRIKKSEVIKVLLGEADPTTLTAKQQQLYEQIITGVML